MKTTQEIKQQKSPENTGIIRDKEGKFVKGQSGNPEGKPKGAFSLISILKEELQKCPEGQDKKTYADLIIKRMLKEAIEKGDDQKLKLIWNYVEGLPKQAVDVTSGGDKIYGWNYNNIQSEDLEQETARKQKKVEDSGSS